MQKRKIRNMKKAQKIPPAYLAPILQQSQGKKEERL
jgi:hypothetical protein